MSEVGCRDEAAQGADGHILAALEEQGKQQAAQLRSQFDQFSATQQQCVDEFSQHLSHQLSLQLSQQVSTWTCNWEKKLRGLEEDLASLKRRPEEWASGQLELERKLGAIEETLNAVRKRGQPVVHSELEERLTSLERELTELREEQRASTSSSLLNLMSRDHRTASWRIHEPAKFDGTAAASWDAYKVQFDMLSQLNHWTNLEKAVYLSASLRGPALAVLDTLPKDKPHDYPTLVAALEARFVSAHWTELHRAQLKSRKQRQNEDLPALAADIERLTHLAYPGDDALPMLDLLAKDHFTNTLPDEEMRFRIRPNKPATMRDA